MYSMIAKGCKSPKSPRTATPGRSTLGRACGRSPAMLGIVAALRLATAGGLFDCTDDGPWPCAEEGCPEPSMSCASLAALGVCGRSFSDIFEAAPPGTEAATVAETAAVVARALGFATVADAPVVGDEKAAETVVAVAGVVAAEGVAKWSKEVAKEVDVAAA